MKPDTDTEKDFDVLFGLFLNGPGSDLSEQQQIGARHFAWRWFSAGIESAALKEISDDYMDALRYAIPKQTQMRKPAKQPSIIKFALLSFVAIVCTQAIAIYFSTPWPLTVVIGAIAGSLSNLIARKRGWV